jgi:hypothetical protein
MGRASRDGVRMKEVKLHSHGRAICTEHTDLSGIDAKHTSPLHTGGGPLSLEELIEEERWNQRGKILGCGIRRGYHVWRHPITSQVDVERRGESHHAGNSNSFLTILIF